jgi:hypothetical protein
MIFRCRGNLSRDHVAFGGSQPPTLADGAPGDTESKVSS